MEMMMVTLFKQKTVWIGFVGVIVVLVVFGLAMMGSVLGAKPKHLPVALVVADQAVQQQDGSPLGIGAMLKDKLLANKQLPISWHMMGSETEAREGLEQQLFYGALILPADLSAGVASLYTADSKPASVKIISNDGLSVQAAAIVKQMLSQMMRTVNMELSHQLLGAIGQKTNAVPVSTAKALLTPIHIQEESVHPVGANHANGNAPGLLTQMMWLGGLVLSVTLFFAMKKISEPLGRRRWDVLLTQAVTGSIFLAAASGFLIWMATAWYGMKLENAVGTWMTLLLVGASFFFLQTALLSWLGMGAMPVLVLLMFFSMSVVNMAPEFLPLAAHDWVYVWTPFRFAATALRNAMYFDSVSVTSNSTTVLWSMIGLAFVLHMTSIVPKNKRSDAVDTAV